MMLTFQPFGVAAVCNSIIVFFSTPSKHDRGSALREDTVPHSVGIENTTPYSIGLSVRAIV
jgi:hypothetical protein